MTRRIVYGAGLVALLIASAMTLASIIVPRWLSYYDGTEHNTQIRYSYGLHRSCSSLTGDCKHFPRYEDCHGKDRYFCSMWRSVGFLMSFAVVMEGGNLIAFLVLLTSGKQTRETGWKVLCFLLLLAAVVQCASMALVAYLYDYDARFYLWQLDSSWILCTVSWSILAITAAGIIAAAITLPSEGGYELIPGEQ